MFTRVCEGRAGGILLCSSVAKEIRGQIPHLRSNPVSVVGRRIFNGGNGFRQRVYFGYAVSVARDRGLDVVGGMEFIARAWF